MTVHGEAGADVAGTLLQVKTPVANLVQVAMPEGVRPGQKFQVQVQARVQAPLPPPQRLAASGKDCFVMAHDGGSAAGAADEARIGRRGEELRGIPYNRSDLA